jgi:hypothetical protein
MRWVHKVSVWSEWKRENVLSEEMKEKKKREERTNEFVRSQIEAEREGTREREEEVPR